MTARGSTSKTLAALAERIRYATGTDWDQLWDRADPGDPAISSVVDAYRNLFRAEQAVTFHRESLNGLSSGRYEIDQAFVPRLQRALRALVEAVEERLRCRDELLNVLEPLEHAADQQRQAQNVAASAADLPALIAIAHGGATLRENLLSHRISVVTSSGRRIPWSAYQRLEAAGFVTRDTSHPLHAGQPVSLTPSGRTALTQARADTVIAAPAPAHRTGAFPSAVPPHRR
ncbi:hypothetical protein ACFS5L_02330 [Streptomyces phyllanthi]|uniref:Uncharacterized protein n=1 Tax=Streptomyces phyllanthi TaxID=1803180 RepID=A0A5N8VTC7_9ACTN|nr:hypothetical protein [Streptomyces phyllanthi]MPY38490.1 hypothetical protein [Streptomyces phyllanthi]